MLHKILFFKKQGGALMLLLFAVFMLPAQWAYAQVEENECVQANCSNLRVEIVRNGNVSTDCGSTSCSDEFRQISYTVYLRHSKTVSDTDPLEPFDLEYDMLDVAVSLQNQDPQFSHIDVEATRACFDNGVGAKWNYNIDDGNKSILELTDKSAGISFANLASGSEDCGTVLTNGTGNVITFTYYTPLPDLVDGCGQDGPPKIRCAYAELFTIVVNAYAGETIGFQFDNRRYIPIHGVSSECTIERVTTGSNNGLSTVQVLNPDHHTGTANEAILAQFLTPTTGASNEKNFPIQIINTGTSTITVSYLEFMIRALTVNLDQHFDYPSGDPRPRESVSSSNPASKFLHYVIPDVGVTLGPNETHIVGSIIVKGPSVSNLSGAVTLTFLDTGNHPSKSRIKTSSECTSLNASGSINGTWGFDNPCTDPSISFNVEAEGITCTTSKVKVGLRTTTPTANIRLRKIEFQLEFFWVGQGVEITGVNFPSTWPSIDCLEHGCYMNPNPPGQKLCWQVSPDGRTFNYCYETDDDPSSAQFSLNDIQYFEILFNKPEGVCIDSVKIKLLRLVYPGGSPACVPVIDPVAGFPQCNAPATMLTGTILTEELQAVEEVKANLSGADYEDLVYGMPNCPDVSCSSACSKFDLTDDLGIYQFSCSDCGTCNKVKVIPEKNDNPLNGVTTFDLVLISRHILGQEPLNSPYKMIAADANKSGSITTFDIVELRKLILGIYDELPNNTSWRFVDKAFMFPNATNPFQTDFPEGINCISFPSSGHDFVAVKVGDVNNNAVGNRPSERPMVGLSWPNFRVQSGEILTVPIRYAGAESLEAIQLGLRFDSNKLQLIGPSIGDIESYLPGNFNLLQADAGEIRSLWLPMTDDAANIQPGNVLFNLSFKVLDDSPNGTLPLWLDHQLLECAAWKPGGAEYLVEQTPAVKRDAPASASIGLTASVVPNPTSGGVTLTVQATKADKGRLTLFDAFGQSLLMREYDFQEGKQDISLPEVASLPAGVYIWKVYTPSLEAQGQLIKQ